MELQKGDLFELPHGRGFVIFKRIEEGTIYFYHLKEQKEAWDFLAFFLLEANKLE